MKILVALLVLSLGAVAPCLGQSAPIVIAGTVETYEPPFATATVTPKLVPVPAIRVEAVTPGATLTTTTDRDGHFRLWNVPPGNVTLRLYRVGYVSMGGTLCLRPGSTTHFHFFMSRGGGSSGFIASAAARNQIAAAATCATPH